MALSRRKVISAVVLAVVVLGVVLLIRSRDPARQAEATFARIKQAVEANDAGDVIDQLHPAYDFAGQWPGYFDNPDYKTVLAAGSDDPTPRSMAKRGLSFLFLRHLQSRLRFLYAIQKVEPRADGTVAVDVTIEVGAADGGGLLVDGIQKRRFVLARTGWLFGTLEVRSHDALDVPITP
ncbi:MAG: hypothetical protein H0V44_16615 [Planctomycetes bacterium]|nr:hypothetical protein [Planctomycetota bacterium]